MRKVLRFVAPLASGQVFPTLMRLLRGSRSWTMFLAFLGWGVRAAVRPGRDVYCPRVDWMQPTVSARASTALTMGARSAEGPGAAARVAFFLGLGLGHDAGRDDLSVIPRDLLLVHGQDDGRWPVRPRPSAGPAPARPAGPAHRDRVVIFKGTLLRTERRGGRDSAARGPSHHALLVDRKRISAGKIVPPRRRWRCLRRDPPRSSHRA
jgi:hypothetical protein